jgi:cytochrome c-type biogenesis protein CcmH/NrfF
MPAAVVKVGRAVLGSLAIWALLHWRLGWEPCDGKSINRSNALFSSIQSTCSIKGHVRQGRPETDIIDRLVVSP